MGLSPYPCPHLGGCCCPPPAAPLLLLLLLVLQLGLGLLRQLTSALWRLLQETTAPREPSTRKPLPHHYPPALPCNCPFCPPEPLRVIMDMRLQPPLPRLSLDPVSVATSTQTPSSFSPRRQKAGQAEGKEQKGGAGCKREQGPRVYLYPVRPPNSRTPSPERPPQEQQGPGAKPRDPFYQGTDPAGGIMAAPGGLQDALRPSPARPLMDLDFPSGARVAELNQLVQELCRGDPGVRAAPELAELKDFVFALLGLVQKLEGRLPATPRLLLLSGGARRGTLDLNPGVLAPYAPGRDYDVDYTLLVPILDARLPLEPGGCPPGYARLSLAPLGPTVAHRWADCSCRHGQEVDLCPSLVSAHFSRSLVATARQSHSHQGGPEVEQADAHGGLVTLILRRGPLRALYDVAPVVAVWGWPEAAQNWLSYGGHFWEGQVRLEDVAASFYLLPCTGPCPEVCSLGDASGLAWPEACGLLEACCPGNTSSLAWPEACSPLEACAPGKASCLGDSPGPVEACAPGEAHCQGNASGLVEAYAPGKACCPGNSPSPGRCEAFNLVEACCPGNASSLAQPEAYSPVEACCLGNACGKAGPESMEACSLSDPRGRAWRLSFASSEFHLKTAMPLPMRQAVQAALALLAGVLAGPVGPYPILAQALRACDRLPAGYLSREDSVAHCLLGLLDDMAASLLAGTCPHPFLPGCDLLGGRPWPGLALQVAAVRRDPARHLRQVVDRVKMTAKMVAKAGRP